MRIDKYLFMVRAYKTRSTATEACRNGRVKINNIEVKPAREVAIKDVVSIKLTAFTRTIEVLDFPKSRIGAKLLDLYILDKTSEEELQKLNMIRERLVLQRPKGSGRPTKKERRDIDDAYSVFVDDFELE